eukprot:10878771-Prorocentrum_lima.AAC.1
MQFLIEARKKGGSDGDLAKLMQEFKALKQDFTMMKDTMASDLTVLEGTIPNIKEVEGILMELDGSLLDINNSVQGLERGLSFVVEQ